jgi:hypothetical protein
LVAADFAPARFDDREVGNGTALERPRYIGGRVELTSDPRGTFIATLADQTQIMGSGIYSTSVQAGLAVHALRQLDIELLPQLIWAVGEFRYASQVSTLTPNFSTSTSYFGKLTAKSVSATLRATYTFTPQLTLQAYTQAFLASGHYDDLQTQMIPTATVALSQLVSPVPLAAQPTGADFEDASLNVSVVFRWEYRLGSTLYFVYTHSQIPTVDPVVPPAMLRLNAFGHGQSSDVVMLKLSYWWAS